MEFNHLLIFLLTYLFIATCALFFSALRKNNIANNSLAVLALGLLIATIVLGSKAFPNQNYLQVLITEVLSRDAKSVLAIFMGAMFGILWWIAISIYHPMSSTNHMKLKTAAVIASLFGASVSVFVLVAFDIFRADLGTKAVEPGFTIETIGEVPALAIRVSVDDEDNPYVVYDTYDNGYQYGTVVKFSRQADGKYLAKTVAESAAIHRPYGIAIRNKKIYISRSGNLIHAKNGGLEYTNAGAVTELQDLDDDGYYEYYNDVVTNLPGARGPSTQHQNNGLAFDSEGALYITSGVNSDREAPEEKLEGVILKASPDFSTLTSFAAGLRNPFGIAIGLDQQIFITDQDITERNPGDELNHIRKGHHYGHPYQIAQIDTGLRGFTPPIHMGQPDGNLVGLDYMGRGRLYEKYKNSLAVGDLSRNQIDLLELEKDGETFKVREIRTLAKVPRVVDVVVSDKGTIFAVSRFLKKLYRISYNENRP